MITQQTQPPELLEEIERGLAQHSVFGDSGYILRQLQTCLHARLDNLSARMPEAGELADALARTDDCAHVVGDTVVRCAIVHAHTQLEIDAPYGLPREDCGEVFAATSERVRRGELGPTLDDGSLTRLGPEQHDGWVWNDGHPDDVFGRCFRYLLRQRYQAVPRSPSSDELAMLAAGAQLLNELLPELTPSALRHAHVIALVPSAGGWKGIASSSQFHLGGTIFLGRALQSAWWVAEHLFHEAMHQKLYDFRHGHTLLDDLSPEEAPKVEAPWNSPRLVNANQWDIHRVYAAFHVYVHLALLARIAEARADELEATYGRLQGMTPSRTAYERAYYLGEQLHERWAHLGYAGQQLTEWLTSVLDFLNPAPPPAGAYVHLCLDLYEREADQIESALNGNGGGGLGTPGLAQRLAPSAREEIVSTRRLLSAVGADEALARFDDVRELPADDDVCAGYPELRRAIAATLRDTAIDRYRFGESSHQDELVRELVMSASERVFAALAGLPEGVAHAKRRASDLRFKASCQDDVGRLLSVLASAVPPNGRILEIGTGAGVGTAWITSGLGERTDVELVTVEADPRTISAVRDWPWPDYVEILAADASAVIDALGAFDLVFADAAPVKYGHIESVLAALQPRGILVIDDLEPGSQTSDLQLIEKAKLRRTIFEDASLRSVEIATSTGVIMAARGTPA